MFKRPHHQRIAHVLRALDGDLLRRAGCYFAGGTAIVLQCGEYRESVDIDFLCADTAGYRLLREAISDQTLGSILRHPIQHVRDVRTDRDKISTYLQVDDTPIRFEMVRESRIVFEPSNRQLLGVPIIDPVDAYAEKLLANADRGADKSTLSRDIIDLAMMMDVWGPIPDRSIEKAQDAYGTSIRRSWDKSVELLLSDEGYLDRCLKTMSMDLTLAARIRDHLRGAWPKERLARTP